MKGKLQNCKYCCRDMAYVCTEKNKNNNLINEFIRFEDMTVFIRFDVSKFIFYALLGLILFMILLFHTIKIPVHIK